MNPYETGLTGCLRGMITRVLASKGQDEFSNTETRFYNPMWQHCRDANCTPRGTCNPIWTEHGQYCNIYYQVLLHPTLLSRFCDRNPDVMSAAGNISLLIREGVPRRVGVSVHLPILFR